MANIVKAQTPVDASAAIGPCVYLIKANKWYKIGYTTYFRHRIKQLATQPPFETQILHIIKVPNQAAELFLHERYAQYRIRGEWFTLPGDDILELMSIQELDDYNQPYTPWVRVSGSPINADANPSAYMLGFAAAFHERPASVNPFARNTICDKSWQWGFMDWLVLANRHSWIDLDEYPEGFFDSLDPSYYQIYIDLYEKPNSKSWTPVPVCFIITGLTFRIGHPSDFFHLEDERV